jgi:hypothetical protein
VISWAIVEPGSTFAKNRRTEVFAIAPAHGWIADFISPSPSQPQADVTSELDAVRMNAPPLSPAGLESCIRTLIAAT